MSTMTAKQRNYEQCYHQAYEYNGYKVMSHYDLNYHQVDKIYHVVQNALDEHPRTFAFRLELWLPPAFMYQDERLMVRFFESFTAKIAHDQNLKARHNQYTHGSSVRYLWAREICNRTQRPHYHVAILVNGDAYHTVGSYNLLTDNLFSRLVSAWASALGLPLYLDYVRTLVSITPNGQFYLNRNQPETLDNFIYRMSYLAKQETKSAPKGCHTFGYSRK